MEGHQASTLCLKDGGRSMCTCACIPTHTWGVGSCLCADVCAHVLRQCSHVQTCAHMCTCSHASSHAHTLTVLTRTCMHTARAHTLLCKVHTHTCAHTERHSHCQASGKFSPRQPAGAELHAQGFLETYLSFLPFLEPVLSLLLNLPVTIPSALYCPLQASQPHFRCCF